MLTTFLLPLPFLLLVSASQPSASGAPYNQGNATASYGNGQPMATGVVSTGYETYPIDQAYPALPQQCVPGQLYCPSADQFRLCANTQGGGTQYAAPGTGQVAAGTICALDKNPASNGYIGKIINKGLKSCGPEVDFVCKEDGMGFMRCDHGVLIDMGSCAPGTKCENGLMVPANGVMSARASARQTMPYAPQGTASGAMPRPTGSYDYKIKRDSKDRFMDPPREKQGKRGRKEKMVKA